MKQDIYEMNLLFEFFFQKTTMFKSNKCIVNICVSELRCGSRQNMTTWNNSKKKKGTVEQNDYNKNKA
jgi:hypothetical protein